MKNYFISLIFLLLCISCKNEDQPYSYLCESESNSESVELIFKSINNIPFSYAFRSREMCIDWGDSSVSKDYIYFGKNDSIENIKPISHPFANNSEYRIKIKALNLVSIDVSKTNENDILSLKLGNCNKLVSLYIENQPIAELDVSKCTSLLELSCGYDGGILHLSDLDLSPKLKKLFIYGSIDNDSLNLTKNDSLKVVFFNNSNCKNFRLTELKNLSSVTFNNCQFLSNIYFSSNSNLRQLVLTNNLSLDATAINKIFESLPDSNNDNPIINLSGNKGDTDCDRTIATQKGWTFKE